MEADKAETMEKYWQVNPRVYASEKMDAGIQFKHPIVQSTPAYCGRAVDRLKAGPVNIPELLC